MASFHVWLDQKYRTWAASQTGTSSTYAFAQYLDIGHSTLTLWISGAALPSPSEIEQLGKKLGAEAFEAAGVTKPISPTQSTLDAQLANLPEAFQTRLRSAIVESSNLITSQGLSVESLEAKRLVVKVFEKWGFRLGG